MTTRLDLQTVVRQADNLLGGAVDDQIVLLNPQDNDYFSMNKLGSRIWERIAAPVSVSQLIDLLLEEFDVERPVCEREVMDFLEELNRAGLVAFESGV